MTAIESLSVRPATVASTLETRVSTDAQVSATTSAVSAGAAERTFSVDEYIAILRQAQSLQRTQALKAEEERTKAIYDSLPAEEKDAQRISMQSLYSSAADIGVDAKTIDDAIAHYHLSTEQLAMAIMHLGGVRTTKKHSRASSIERLKAYQAIFVEELSSRLPECRVVAKDRNSLFHRLIYNYLGECGGESGAQGLVLVHRPGKRRAVRVFIEIYGHHDKQMERTADDRCYIDMNDPSIAPPAMLGIKSALERACSYRAKHIGSYRDDCVSPHTTYAFDPTVLGRP